MESTSEDYEVADLSANILAMPIPRWKLCCCTLQDKNGLLSRTYKTPIQDTQDHVPCSELSNCIVTGKSIETGKFGMRTHKDAYRHIANLEKSKVFYQKTAAESR